MRSVARREAKIIELIPSLRAAAVGILNRPESELIGNKAFRGEQRLLAVWAAECAERVLPLFEEKYPEDYRPRRAIESCREWIRTGVFSMKDVRMASLSSHAAARMAQDAGNHPACYSARAAGHAVATAHVPTHAFGAPGYALKAVTAASSPTDVEANFVKEHDWQIQRLRELARERNSLTWPS